MSALARPRMDLVNAPLHGDSGRQRNDQVLLRAACPNLLVSEDAAIDPEAQTERRLSENNQLPAIQTQNRSRVVCMIREHLPVRGQYCRSVVGGLRHDHMKLVSTPVGPKSKRPPHPTVIQIHAGENLRITNDDTPPPPSKCKTAEATAVWHLLQVEQSSERLVGHEDDGSPSPRISVP